MSISKETWHVCLAIATLGGSTFVAFGPLRQRLPKVLTRFARFSMCFKLLVLATISGTLLWHNARDGGPVWSRWTLAVITSAFVVSAVRLAFVSVTAPAA